METTYNLSMSDQKALSISKTIKQFGQNLFGFVRGKVKSTEDAEDILQDVWYQLTKLNNIAELENISGWLYEVARNKIIDKSRKKSTAALEDFTYESDDGVFNFKEVLLLDDSQNPELGFFKELFWTEFQNALEELPPAQKEVFLLNEMEDMTLQQIADQSGENLKTIISRKGYAVKHLRKRLNYLYEELNN
jgi:RNA polymerase sigma factor (sigma-70 family)